MSLSYRLGEIESAIPYADVQAKWASTSRDKWLANVLQHHGNGVKMAELTMELLDAFTPSCKDFLWKDDEGGFKRMREACQRVKTSSMKKGASAGKELREVRFAIIEPPPPIPPALPTPPDAMASIRHNMPHAAACSRAHIHIPPLPGATRAANFAQFPYAPGTILTHPGGIRARVRARTCAACPHFAPAPSLRARGLLRAPPPHIIHRPAGRMRR
jgi:hypothetical protein